MSHAFTTPKTGDPYQDAARIDAAPQGESEEDRREERMARYTINGRPVPSVTEILGELLPTWQADPWYLGRGTAVHACCAMIARGEAFDCDPVIAGQVAACRKWFADFSPAVHHVERKLHSERYQYAGTPDLICAMGKIHCVVDFKASLNPVVALQLGGYSELLSGGYNHGMGVELREDGTYTTTGLLDLRIPRREFLALRTVYGVRERLGMLQNRKDRLPS